MWGGFGWGSSAKDDTKRYRDGYPGQENDLDAKANLLFYFNKLQSRPRGDFIDTIHVEWRGRYELLEAHHGYIQWLFPIREEGMNSQSQRLHLHELLAIKADATARKRILRSYRLMLDFYGLVLVNSATGELAHSHEFKSRFYNLNTSGHNYLRITRILKCLGEFGYEHLQAPFCKFILREVSYGVLKNTLDSCIRYWCPVIKSDTERAEILAYGDDVIAIRKGEKAAPAAREIHTVDPIWDDPEPAKAAAGAGGEDAKNKTTAAAAAAGSGTAADAKSGDSKANGTAAAGTATATATAAAGTAAGAAVVPVASASASGGVVTSNEQVAGSGGTAAATTTAAASTATAAAPKQQ